MLKATDTEKVIVRSLNSIVGPQKKSPVRYTGKHQLVRVSQWNEQLYIPGEHGLAPLRPDDGLTVFPPYGNATEPM